MVPFCILAIENEDDREFMTRLYLDYSRLMQQQITKIVQDEWAAEDLMQTTLVKLIDKVQDLRTKDRNHLINYIISACKNQARNYMRDKNRHAEYSIHYYLPSYSYNTIASHCEQIARDKGYATLEYNDDGELEWNYYIDLGNLAPFARECAAYYNLGKSISSSMLTWSTGTSEISNGRPILLSIWHSDQYEDHTVTAFAWTSFQIVEVDIYMNFFKVKAGRVAASRYVCYQTVTGSFITKFV